MYRLGKHRGGTGEVRRGGFDGCDSQIHREGLHDVLDRPARRNDLVGYCHRELPRDVVPYTEAVFESVSIVRLSK